MSKLTQKSWNKSNIWLGLAAFSTYFCMYAFRKPFTAATFEGYYLWGIEYKIVLVISQVMGYATAKGLGIKIIAEMEVSKRAYYLLTFMGAGAVSLLFFALLPMPYNFPCLFINGLALGLIFGLVFGYIEGRQITELLGAGLAVSFIVASGVVKSVGRWLLVEGQVSEQWMPLLTGLLFTPLLLWSVWQLHHSPKPSLSDEINRSPRTPMPAQNRKIFFANYGFGLIALILIYVVLTIIRDVRDNFSVELWHELGVNNAAIFASTETQIGLAITFISGLLFLVKNHTTAFWLNHASILMGSLLILLATVLFQQHQINPFLWMTLLGLGMYMGYVPFNCMLFERLMAILRFKGNAGFLFYTADFCGYLGSVFILLYKNFNKSTIQWLPFFIQLSWLIPVFTLIMLLISFLFFSSKLTLNARFTNTPNSLHTNN